MNLQELHNHLETRAGSLKEDDQALLRSRLRGLVSVFPFSEYEYILTFLVDRRVIGFDWYEQLRQDYVSTNPYLDLFSLAPRIFGQIWGEQHLMDIDPRFCQPDRSLDPGYDGQYDLWVDGLRVEVKSARAIDTKKRGSLASKALQFGASEPFWMNFQQLKPDACDIFVFIGVWVDRIVYWVLSNQAVRTNRYLSHQHRGGIEYQVGVTHKNIAEFDVYAVDPASLVETILSNKRTRS